MNKKPKIGVSLILLVIIIIIILILAGAIMLSLSKNNPIDQASKAVFLNDLRMFQTELNLYETQQFADQKGLYDPSLLQADETSITYDGVVDTSKTMNDLIPSLERAIKYAGQFEVVDGKLVFKGTDKNIQDWCKEAGVDINEAITLMNPSSGSYQTFVLSNNNLYGTGMNEYSELGDGTTTNSTTFLNISAINGIKFKKIATGGKHTLGIGTDGELYAWGANWDGQLGDGTTIDKHIPTKIILASGVKPVQITCGEYHSMAIGDDGNLYTWGYNGLGQLGDGTFTLESYLEESNYTIRNATKTETIQSIPEKITLASGVKPKQIACGEYNSMAIGDDNNLYAWGDDSYGELGDGISESDIGPYGSFIGIPEKIILASGVKPTQIACACVTTIAIGDDGNVYTFGLNYNGEIGNGTVDNNMYSTPIKVSLPNGIKATQLTCGWWHVMVIGSDKELYGWGANWYGQLGQGTNTDYEPTPLKITLSNGVKPTQIFGGEEHSAAIGDDGNLYTWGVNDGQLGDGTTDNKSTPTRINFKFE